MNFTSDLARFYIIIGIVAIFIMTLSKSSSREINIPPNKSFDMEWTEAVNEKKPIVIYFYVDWCGACRSFTPILDRVVDKYDSQYTFLYVNCDESDNKEMVKTFKVHSYPSLFIGDPKINKYVKVRAYQGVQAIVQEFDKALNDIVNKK